MQCNRTVFTKAGLRFLPHQSRSRFFTFSTGYSVTLLQSDGVHFQQTSHISLSGRGEPEQATHTSQGSKCVECRLFAIRTASMFIRPTSHSTALGPGCTGPSLAHYTPDKLDAYSGPSLQQPLAGGAPFLVDAQAAAASHAGSDPRKHTTYVIPTTCLRSVLGGLIYSNVLILLC